MANKLDSELVIVETKNYGNIDPDEFKTPEGQKELVLESSDSEEESLPLSSTNSNVKSKIHQMAKRINDQYQS